MANNLHDKVFEFLEQYRTTHPEFVYWFRERNTRNRLTDGYWFQDNENYAFVGLYDRSGGSNMTRSVGFLIESNADKINSRFEVVFNEEQDPRFLKFYHDVMTLCGGFNRLSETRYYKILSETNGLEATRDFLDSYKASLDKLVKESNLEELFISTQDFKNKLQRIIELKNHNQTSMVPNHKISELKNRYDVFKSHDFYKKRVNQLAFVDWAKNVILETLKVPLTNDTVTGLIQILKNGSKKDNINKYIEKNIVDDEFRVQLIEWYSKINQTGFTGAGKAAVTKLSDNQLIQLHQFLVNSVHIKTVDEAVKLVNDFIQLNLPEVKAGVYSPWLYYINPEIFPIFNNSHADFIVWCEQPPNSYPMAIKLFHEVAQILEESNLGLIDAFAHLFTKNPDKKQLITTNVMQYTLNTILYGPPGTGKTYHTIDIALKITDPIFYNDNKYNRKALTDRFKELLINDFEKSNGQIAFTTFHQSLSYEDFIEGIKPDTNTGAKEITYSIEHGIFKKLCRIAESKVSVEDNFEEVYKNLLQEIEENDGSLVLKTPKKGKAFTIYENSKRNLRFHANTDKAYEGVIRKEVVSAYLQKGELLDWPSYTASVGEYIKSKFQYKNDVKSEEKNYVLIIDEINRGNVSQIFGELITLIEKDKRKGSLEELSTILPYSKETFSVPLNLYIVGTMNTADRSVEALDTALRRRFSFKEMLPNPQLLSPFDMLIAFYNHPDNIYIDENDWMQEPYFSKANAFYDLIGMTREQESIIYDQNFDPDRFEWLSEDINIKEDELTGINLKNLLIKINERLEKLLSKDHQIGHAFFIHVLSASDLYNAFYQKLIPQLQEYFYGDYGKIGLVIGSSFVKIKEDNNVSFAAFNYDDAQLLLEKKIYTISDFKDDDIPDYNAFISAVKTIY